MIRALLVDDEPQVLEGLEMLLATDPALRIVGTATTVEAALSLARREQPDIVIMDVRLGAMDGIAATRQFANELPETVVIILSLYGDPETRRRAAAAGAKAFVAKHDMGDELLATIRRLATERTTGETVSLNERTT